MGPSGRVLQDVCKPLGLPRLETRLVNVLACRPPANRLHEFLLRVSRENKKRSAAGEPTWMTPMDCCRPRLLHDLEGMSDILCLGGTAARAVGSDRGIDIIRGSGEQVKLEGRWVKVFYANHPARIFREPTLRWVFERDIAKAIRFFDGTLRWQTPMVEVVDSVAMLGEAIRYFRKEGRLLAYDVETTRGLQPKLLCIGFSSMSRTIVVPLVRRDGVTPYWRAKDEQLVKSYLHALLKPDRNKLVGHNAQTFDRWICEQELGVTPRLAADTMGLALLADNDRPKDLGFLLSVWTDNPEAWKAEHAADESKTEEELHGYNGKDAYNTARLAPVLHREIGRRRQGHLLQREIILADIGHRMRRAGIQVDRSEVTRLHNLCFRKLRVAMDQAHEVAGPMFNPLSYPQLTKLLYTDWKLPILKVSEQTGEASTDDDVLRRMLFSGVLDPGQRQLVLAVRQVRKHQKMLSTYIDALLGFTFPDGRIHPSYLRIPASGRYSAKDPAIQTFPDWTRGMFCAGPGQVIVAADMDQLELRLIAQVAGAKRLLEDFRSGKDPHNERMEIIYGTDIWSLDGAPAERTGKGEENSSFKNTRGVTKNTGYAWQYGAAVERIWEQVVSAEDADGNLLYGHITPEDVKDVCDGLAKADPEIPHWWQKQEREHRKRGYVSDPVWGRIRALPGATRSDLANHPIQAGGHAIMSEALVELIFGRQKWFATWRVNEQEKIPVVSQIGFELILETHDGAYLEGPEDRTEEAKHLLQSCMCRVRKDDDSLTYTAKAKAGHSMGET